MIPASPNPTWYDVLGVSRDATPAEIKAAWRNATDKFEPGSGSGQFRAAETRRQPIGQQRRRLQAHLHVIKARELTILDQRVLLTEVPEQLPRLLRGNVDVFVTLQDQDRHGCRQRQECVVGLQQPAPRRARLGVVAPNAAITLRFGGAALRATLPWRRRHAVRRT